MNSECWGAGAAGPISLISFLLGFQIFLYISTTLSSGLGLL